MNFNNFSSLQGNSALITLVSTMFELIRCILASIVPAASTRAQHTYPNKCNGTRYTPCVCTKNFCKSVRRSTARRGFRRKRKALYMLRDTSVSGKTIILSTSEMRIVSAAEFILQLYDNTSRFKYSSPFNIALWHSACTFPRNESELYNNNCYVVGNI